MQNILRRHGSFCGVTLTIFLVFSTGSLTQALALAQLTGPQIAGLARLASGLVIRSRGCHFAPSLRSPLTSVPAGSQASQASRSDQTWWAKCGKSEVRIRHSKLVCRSCEIPRTRGSARGFFCDDLDNGHALLYNSLEIHSPKTMILSRKQSGGSTSQV